MKKTLIAVVILVAVAAVAIAVSRREAPAGDSAVGAVGDVAAKTPWGDPNITGVWKTSRLGAVPEEDTWNLKALDALYRPGVRDGLSPEDDPTRGCFKAGFPRAFTFGTPLQIVQNKGLTTVLTETYPAFRIIPSDGRPHMQPDFRYPTFMGDSSARWEGDTLVVDVVSFNGRTWLASGMDKPNAGSPGGVWPTSDTLHITERWRRVDANTLEYTARIEDPSMLSAPWEPPTVVLQRQPQTNIEEELCLEHEDPSNYLRRWD